ncbi:MAG TPA: outer membrane protein assembly factor BamE [Thiobacillus sp.]
MRRFLISALLLSLVAGCSSVNLGPHRIDVQQGNALDQENVSRLKTGLNRSQVRFLLGTPLVVDPFRTDRWDYVYVNYKSGKLAEQKRITLFFDGETLVRMEGDLPVPEVPASTPVAVASPVSAQSEAKVENAVNTSTAEARPLPAAQTPKAEPLSQTSQAEPLTQAPKAEALPATRAAVPQAAHQPMPQPVAQAERAEATPKAVVQPSVNKAASAEMPESARQIGEATSIVPPLPSPKNVPAYRDPRTPAELSLQAETNVDQIKPDVIPTFPEPGQVTPASQEMTKNDEAVLSALNAWVNAWARRDDEAYLAAYDASFVPQGGASRAAWEKSRRTLLGVAKNIEVRIDSPSVDYLEDGVANVTFNQFYRSDSYRDAVVKQLRMQERDGQWLIAEERVLSILRGAKR